MLSKIQNIEKSLTITTQPVKESWKKKFLRSPAGKQFLNNQQKEKQCLIVFEKHSEIALEEKNSEKPYFQDSVLHLSCFYKSFYELLLYTCSFIFIAKIYFIVMLVC